MRIGINTGISKSPDAALGYTYSWAMDCADDRLLFLPGTGTGTNLPFISGAASDPFVVTQVYDGWKVIRNPSGSPSGKANIGTGDVREGKLGIAPNGTSSANGLIPPTAFGLTNKYMTYVITFLVGYDLPELNYGAIIGEQIYGNNEDQQPPSHINGTKIAEDDGSGDITLLPEYSSTRDAVTGLLNDGSEKGMRLSMTFDLSTAPALDVENENLYRVAYLVTNAIQTYNLGFILHGFILGPDPVPAISGPIHIASPNPPIAV